MPTSLRTVSSQVMPRATSSCGSAGAATSSCGVAQDSGLTVISDELVRARGDRALMMSDRARRPPSTPRSSGSPPLLGAGLALIAGPPLAGGASRRARGRPLAGIAQAPASTHAEPADIADVQSALLPGADALTPDAALLALESRHGSAEAGQIVDALLLDAARAAAPWLGRTRTYGAWTPPAATAPTTPMAADSGDRDVEAPTGAPVVAWITVVGAAPRSGRRPRPPRQREGTRTGRRWR